MTVGRVPELVEEALGTRTLALAADIAAATASDPRPFILVLVYELQNILNTDIVETQQICESAI